MKKTMLIAVMAGLLIGSFALAQIPNIPGVKIDKKDKEAIEKGVETYKEVDKTKKEVDKASKAWEYTDERATGQTVAAQLAKAYGGVWKNEAWTKYVNLVGRSLVPWCDRSDIKYRFAILNSKEVNAFSCPGGYIFITKGLLKRCKNEAELAGVLAHEIGHTAKRHVEKAVKNQNVAGALMEGGLSLAQTHGQVNKEQIKAIKGVAGAGYDLLVKTGYSREDEFQADQEGLDTMYRLGYNPLGMTMLLKELDDEGSVSDLQVMLRTHPPNKDRIQALRKRIADKGYQTEGTPLLEDRFQKMMSANPIK